MPRPLPPNLAALQPIDMRDALASLPQRRGQIGQLAAKTSATLHYAGTHEPGATTDQAALAQIRSEAVYHINKIWGYDRGHPIYGDGIMYHLAVLPSGRPVMMRELDAVLYHCANATGNGRSLAITTLRGIGQEMSDQQWSGVVAVHEALAADFHFSGAPAASLKGHREWPRSDSTPQSVCPGNLIFSRLVDYRAGHTGARPVPRPLGVYQVTATAGLSVRTGPNVGYQKAQGNTLVYSAGHEFTVDAVVPDDRGMARLWLHTTDGYLAGDADYSQYLHS